MTSDPRQRKVPLSAPPPDRMASLRPSERPLSARPGERTPSLRPSDRSPSGAPAVPRPLGHGVDWQRLWLSTLEQGAPWRSLALVPGGTDPGGEWIQEVASALSQIGTMHLGVAVHVADARSIELAHMVAFREQVERCSQGTDRVLIALPPIASSVTSAAIARAADACMLCILRDVTRLSELKETVDAVGRSRFNGAAMFSPPAR